MSESNHKHLHRIEFNRPEENNFEGRRKSKRISEASTNENETELRNLFKHFDVNQAIYDPLELRTLVMFFNEELQYVDQLEVLEVQKLDLNVHGIPYYDLDNLFGCVSEIKNFHKHYLPNTAVDCLSIEDVLKCLLDNKKKLRWYILDYFKKHQSKFHGSKAILKRFYSNTIVHCLTLPERRIVDYMKFTGYLKTKSDSIIIHQSLEFFKNLYMQMQYSKQLASIENISQHICVSNDVLYVDNFQLSVDRGTPIGCKVYCMDNVIIISSPIPNSKQNMNKIDYYINNKKIKFAGKCQDDCSFELIEYLENNKKRSLIFTAENGTIKSNWADAIQNVLYKQLMEEKYKAQTP